MVQGLATAATVIVFVLLALVALAIAPWSGPLGLVPVAVVVLFGAVAVRQYRRGHRARPLATSLYAAAVLAVAVFAVVVGPIIVEESRGSCGDRERAALNGVPHAGGVSAPVGEDGDSCFVSYDAPAQPSAVVAHYRRELERAGWEVTAGEAHVDATRGRLSLSVILEDLGDRTGVLVSVTERGD